MRASAASRVASQRCQVTGFVLSVDVMASMLGLSCATRSQFARELMEFIGREALSALSLFREAADGGDSMEVIGRAGAAFEANLVEFGVHDERDGLTRDVEMTGGHELFDAMDQDVLKTQDEHADAPGRDLGGLVEVVESGCRHLPDDVVTGESPEAAVTLKPGESACDLVVSGEEDVDVGGGVGPCPVFDRQSADDDGTNAEVG
jgi:hypothetical protein